MIPDKHHIPILAAGLLAMGAGTPFAEPVPTALADDPLPGRHDDSLNVPERDRLPPQGIPGRIVPARGAEEEPPVVGQADLGENACGPCAVVNALLRATAPYRSIPDSLDGVTAKAKVETLIRRFSESPSIAYDGELAYHPERGITWVDLAACFNQLLSERGLPRLECSYLDRDGDEALDVHVRRIHNLFATSIRNGVPVITSVRSFAPKQRDDGTHEWHKR